MKIIARPPADEQGATDAPRPARPHGDHHGDDHHRLLLRAADVAALTGFSPRAVYRLAAQGRLPGVVRVGRTLRFSRAAVLRWANGEESSVQ